MVCNCYILPFVIFLLTIDTVLRLSRTFSKYLFCKSSKMSSRNTKRHDFPISVRDQRKFSEHLPTYSGASREEWLEFTKHLRGFVDDLAAAGECKTWVPTSFDKIISGEESLSNNVSHALLDTLHRKTTGAAESIVKPIRFGETNGDSFQQAFKQLDGVWHASNSLDFGVSQLLELYTTKYQPGEDLRDFHKYYLGLFDHLCHMDLFWDGRAVVVKYLECLSKVDETLLSQIRIAILSDQNASKHIAAALKIVEAHVHLRYPDFRLPPQTNFIANATMTSGPESHNVSKVDCDYCGGRHLLPRRDHCPAFGKSCDHCGRRHHFARVCRSKLRSNDSTTVDKTKVNPRENNGSKQSSSAAHCTSSNSLPVRGTFIGLDTHANLHTVTRKDLFISEITPVQLCINTSASGKVYHTEGRGTIEITLQTQGGEYQSLQIPDVYYAPAGSEDLLSVAKLEDLGIWMDTKAKQLITDTGIKYPFLVVNDLFKLQVHQHQVNLACSFPRGVVVDRNLLHKQLGHVNYRQIRDGHTGVIGIDDKLTGEFEDCPTCIQVKSKHTTVPSMAASGQSSDEFSADIVSFPTSFDGHIGAIVLIDHRTSDVRTALIKDRQRNTISIFTELLSTMRKPDGDRLILDRDGRFTAKEFKAAVKPLGAKITYAPPKRHEFNGVAERMIQTLTNRTMCLLHEANWDIRYWPWAFRHATFLTRRLGCKHNNFQSPFELITGHQYDASELKIFGCQVYYRVDPANKLERRFAQGIYIGQEEDNTYGTVLIYNPETRCVSRRHLVDCKFAENVFPTLPTLPPLEPVDDRNENNTQDHNDETPIDSEYVGPFQHEVGTTSPDNPPTPQAHCAHTTITKAKNKFTGPEPKTYLQIKYRDDRDDWYNAVELEVTDLQRRGTYELVDVTNLPPNTKVLPSHFVFTLKRDGRKKARLVAGGHKQLHTTISDTSSPTLKTSSLFILLAIGAHYRLDFRIMDIRNAYLWASLPTPIYLRPPAGYNGIPENKLMKLQKSLYGLQESGRLWYETLRTTLSSLDLQVSKFDPCVFYNSSLQVFLGCYVDDLIIICEKAMADRIEAALNQRFETTRSEFDYLGVSISATDQGFTISHARYAEAMLERFGMRDCNYKQTPLPTDTTLCAAEVPEETTICMNEAAGCLQWLARYRPDLAFAAHQIAKIADRPTSQHEETFRHVLRYIKRFPDLRLHFPFSDQSLQLQAFTDASWANDKLTRKSTGGALFYLGPYLIHYYSRTIHTVATSSTHAEVLEISRTGRTLQALAAFLEELGFPQETIPVYTDSSGAIHSTAKLTCTEEAKHYDVRLKEIKQLRDKGFLTLIKIDGKDNPADILTAQRPRQQFHHLLNLTYFSNQRCTITASLS